ncbi:hypothetical protein [Nocardiopsis alba]|uniref:hypothetical protein n=1 Tax=Nocardiopsis alba TaxID=53437 RepID=UPI001F28EBC3|nr:hypothetical protein [Nocardiopsis alba]
MSRHHVHSGRKPARAPHASRPRRCGKRWFRDSISAELALAAIRHHGSDRSDRMPRRAYECPACKGWHLTSQEGRTRSAGTSSVQGRGPGAPRPRRAEPGRAGEQRALRTGQTMRAWRVVQGLEPWVAAHVEEHLAEHGRGPTWRELEAVFGWNQWEGALAIRYLVDQGWLREEPASPHLLPAAPRTAEGPPSEDNHRSEQH